MKKKDILFILCIVATIVGAFGLYWLDQEIKKDYARKEDERLGREAKEHIENYFKQQNSKLRNKDTIF